MFTLFNKLGSVCMKCALRFLLSSIDDFVSLLLRAVLPGGPCLVAACLHAHTMISIRDISSLSFNPSKRKEKKNSSVQTNIALITWGLSFCTWLLSSSNLTDKETHKNDLHGNLIFFSKIQKLKAKSHKNTFSKLGVNIMHIHSTATVYISHDVASTDSKAIFFAAFSLTCCHIYTAWTPYLAHFMVYMYLFHHSLTISIYLVCHFYPEEHQSSTSTPINHTKQKHVNQSILGYPVTTTCL